MSYPPIAQLNNVENGTADYQTPVWDNTAGLYVPNNILQTDIDNNRIIIGLSNGDQYKTANIAGNMNFETIKVPNSKLLTLTETDVGTGVLTPGTYIYRVGFYNADGIAVSQAAGDYTAITITGNSNIQVDNIPVAGDLRVTGRKIFRTKVNQSEYQAYLSKTISNNTGTNIKDNTPDASLDTTVRAYRYPNATAGQIYVDNILSFFSDILGLNTIVGPYAYYNNISGSGSTIVGHSAGKSNTNGHSNSLFGNQVIVNSINGSNNTISGYAAGYAPTSNTTFNDNTVSGANAARTDSTAIRNVGYNAVHGGNAMYGGTGTQNYNVVIGYSAGSVVFRDGSYNILIGNAVDTPAASTSNYLNIGNLITGNLSGKSVAINYSPSVYSRFSVDSGGKTRLYTTGNEYIFQAPATTDKDALSIAVSHTGVDANYTSRAVFSVSDYAASREVFQAEADGAKATATIVGQTMFTEIGGIARKVVNKTGAASVKGSAVIQSAGTDNGVSLATDAYNIIGFIYNSGVADGSEVWMVYSGVAEALVVDAESVTRGDFCQSSTTAGRVTTGDIPSPPNADSHFKETGHALESQTAGTDVLFKIQIHLL